VFAVCSVTLPACTLQDDNLSAGAPAVSTPAGPGRTSGSGPLPPIDPPSAPGTAAPDAGASTGTPGAGPDGSAGQAPTPDAAADRVPVPPAFAVGEVATWRGGADGAYSIIHGSVCDPSAAGGFAHADPELTRRGLRAGFSVIAGSCGGPGALNQWPKVRALADHGHDIVNHSFSFACLGGARCGGARRSLDFALEIDQAGKLLEENTGRPVRYFAFPFDTCGPEAIAHLRQRDYLGARCGPRGVSDAQLADGFDSKNDVWGPAYSIYGTKGPCLGLVQPNANIPPQILPPACRAFVLNQYVEDAIAAKGWALRTLTGFLDDPGAFQPIAVEDYTAHLDFVKGKADAGQLWVAGPTSVLRYRWAREKCAPPTIDGNLLRFPEASPDCQRVATPLSYVVTALAADPPATLKVTQSRITVMAKTLGRGRYLVDADPTQGEVLLEP
jgi:hypothetical protein